MGLMGSRVRLLFLIVLSINWVYTEARTLMRSGISVTQINYLEQEHATMIPDADLKNEQVCTLCEQFAEQAIYYLGENKTQAEIIENLHQACSRLRTFHRECVTLVDYYAPLFFVEIALVNPNDFCRKVNLCEETVLISARQYEDSCELCHRALAEILIKLKDPDTQLDIIEALLKQCERVENYTKKCKKLVFEYGPLILANAEQFLEKNDLCTSIHVCKTTGTAAASLAEM